MFKLIRRISYSVIPRPDRPWEEDPTSNAPTRRKRRISSTEPETADEQERGKKKKIASDEESKEEEKLVSDGLAVAEKDGGHTTPEACADNEDGVQREGSVEIKFVTKGVKEVELDDKTGSTEEPTINAESHPGTEDAAEEEEDAEGQSDDTREPAANAAQEGAVVHPESIPLPGGDDDSDELASSSPGVSVVDSFGDTTAESSSLEGDGGETPHVELIAEDSTSASSPDKRPRTRASTSPRKPPSQSPQKLFTTA